MIRSLFLLLFLYKVNATLWVKGTKDNEKNHPIFFTLQQDKNNKNENKKQLITIRNFENENTAKYLNNNFKHKDNSNIYVIFDKNEEPNGITNKETALSRKVARNQRKFNLAKPIANLAQRYPNRKGLRIKNKNKGKMKLKFVPFHGRRPRFPKLHSRINFRSPTFRRFMYTHKTATNYANIKNQLKNTIINYNNDLTYNTLDTIKDIYNLPNNKHINNDFIHLQMNNQNLYNSNKINNIQFRIPNNNNKKNPKAFQILTDTYNPTYNFNNHKTQYIYPSYNRQANTDDYKPLENTHTNTYNIIYPSDNTHKNIGTNGNTLDFKVPYNKLNKSLRKRLQQFLPKRYHWLDEEDFDSLGYYWFNGPQGKYPGPYRVPY